MELQFKGHTIYLDEEDYHFLKEVKFYVRRDGYTYYLRDRSIIHFHRLVTNCPKDKQVDHINGNGLDNRKCNLRICTRAQNQQNRSKGKNTSSKFKGVSWRKDRNKWRACIRINGKLKIIGLFDRAREAAKAYNHAALRYFGEYAKINKFN